jgi:hypothetical protein
LKNKKITQKKEKTVCPKDVFVVIKIQKWKVRTSQHNHRMCHKKREQAMGPVYKTLEQAQENIEKRIQNIKYDEFGEVTPTPHTWEQITTFKVKTFGLE